MGTLEFTALIGLASGIFGGLASGWAAIYIYIKQNKNVEADEIRKKKMDNIFKLLSYRYVLSDGYKVSIIEAVEFNSTMSLLAILFNNDKDVIKKLDRLHVDKSDSNLIDLLKTASSKLGYDIADHYIKSPILIKAHLFELSVNANQQDQR